MDLWDSIVRVMWDPDSLRLVLVPSGAPMWAPVAVDGQQEVQSVALVRGAGVKHYPRANESHRISFTLCRLTPDTVEDAMIARLAAGSALPRTTKDVLLTFDNGRQFRLKNCAVQSWPHTQDDHLTRETVTIMAGEMVADLGTYVDGDVWGEIPAAGLLAEDDTALLAEDFTYLLTEAAA